MPAPSPAERRALTRRHQTTLTTISARAIPIVARSWADLTSYLNADLAAFTDATAPIAGAVKAAAVTASIGYYAAVLRVPAPSIDVAAIPTEFNARSPFLAVWKGLNDGRPLEEAAAIGGRQAAAATANLTISSARLAGDEFTSRAGLDGRVMRVAESDCCPWCAGLDGTTWPSAEAMDFGHDNCHCVPEPIS